MFPITPLHLCNTLKMCGTWNKKWDRQHLLCYAANDKNYQNLSGLPLLPLQDQSWTSFRPSGAAVYLCTHKESKALLGLEGQLTSVQVDHTVQEILQDIAESGKCCFLSCDGCVGVLLRYLCLLEHIVKCTVHVMITLS